MTKSEFAEILTRATEGDHTALGRIFELYADASAFGGKTVTVCGWVRSIRDSKALGFIDLNDGVIIVWQLPIRPYRYSPSHAGYR